MTAITITDYYSTLQSLENGNIHQQARLIRLITLAGYLITSSKRETPKRLLNWEERLLR